MEIFLINFFLPKKTENCERLLKAFSKAIMKKPCMDHVRIMIGPFKKQIITICEPYKNQVGTICGPYKNYVRTT